ncbi:MAG: hypothetical protein RLY82_1169 [Pseudomonadota bacterium]|jgi:uncharacterized protein YfiM (DUF2279 family)
MSLERKQQADLVRHREFNALRRLMVQRNPQSRLAVLDETSVQVSRFETTQALTKIDALEKQMSQQILGVQSGAEFGYTRIAPISQTTQKNIAARSDNPVVKDAADHFANGNMLLAQTTLEQAVSSSGGQHDQTRPWLALLDLYRATNQPDRFEAYALDFSVRFGRSAPSWISFPNQAELAAQEHAQVVAGSPDTLTADWASPVFLTPIDLENLSQRIQMAQSTTRQIVLDWYELKGIDSSSWAEFQTVLDNLADLPLRCKMRGVARLELAFTDATPAAMLAKLAFIRCKNEAQLFEDIAMDYCMKFEVSPPDWVLPKCRLEEADTQLASSTISGQVAMPIELYGVLEGEHAELLMKTMTPSEALVIRCDRLVRCDASTSAKLVKWAQIALERFGYHVEFYGVHRLIEAYLMMQGIAPYAKVTLRKD